MLISMLEALITFLRMPLMATMPEVALLFTSGSIYPFRETSPPRCL